MNTQLLNQLYQRYYREIYLYLLSLSKNRTTAEDLLQETFLKAILSLPDSHGNTRAWLYMVARTLSFNQRKQEQHLTLTDESEALSAEDDLLEQIISDEKRKLLYLGLSRLEERKREVLQMQYFGGLSQKEIAAVLHLTPEHVRVLAYRARKELRNWMEENGYDIS